MTTSESSESVDIYERIYGVVRSIPPGRVATYGQIAALCGRPRHARQIGYALFALESGSDVPWFRVVNSRGEISARGGLGSEGLQKALLEDEDVVFSLSGRIDLKRYQWDP